MANGSTAAVLKSAPLPWALPLPSPAAGKTGLVVGDREQACKFTDRDVATGGDFDGQVVERVVPGDRKNWLNCHRRLVVEQDDELLRRYERA